MDKIKKYIDRFLKEKSINQYYELSFSEMISLVEAVRQDIFKAVTTTFKYGYAKGYRAAISEMKKAAK